MIGRSSAMLINFWALGVLAGGCEGGASRALESWSAALTGPPTKLSKLYAADPMFDLRFSEVQLVGDELLVGAPGGFRDGNFGSVYVYRRTPTGWEQIQKVIPEDGVGSSIKIQGFGRSISVTGDLLAVGAPGPDSGVGSAFAYRRTETGWRFQQHLMGSESERGNQFGSNVAAGDGWIAVGSGYNPFQKGPGSMQMYRWAAGNWVAGQRLVASNSRTSDQFGLAADFDGDLLLIGAPSAFVFPGTAYVFQLVAGSWTERQILTENTIPDSLGWSVDLQADVLLVGAPGQNINRPYAGGVIYVYGRSGTDWHRRQTLTPPTITGSIYNTDRLGRGVTRLADTLLASDGHHLFLWKLVAGQWTEHAWLAPEPGLFADAWAGEKVSMSPTAIVCGNENSGANGAESGVVHYSFGHPVILPADGGVNTSPDGAAPDTASGPTADAVSPDAVAADVQAHADAQAPADGPVDSNDAQAPADGPVDSTDAAIHDATEVGDRGDAGREAGDAGGAGDQPGCSCTLGGQPPGAGLGALMAIAAVFLHARRRKHLTPDRWTTRLTPPGDAAHD